MQLGVYVNGVLAGSAAAREPTLSVGDRILYINDCAVDGLSLSDVNKLLDESEDQLLVNVVKHATTPSSGIVSSSSMSSGPMLSSGSPSDVISASPPSPRGQLWESSPESTSKYLSKSNSSQTSQDSPQVTSSRSATASQQRPHSYMHPEVRRRGDGMENHAPLLPKSQPPSDVMIGDEEDEVLKKLDSVIAPYTSKSPKKSVTMATQDSVARGTWPRCRFHPDEQGNMVQPSAKKERAPLHDVIKENTSCVMHKSSVPDPPERKESFNRHIGRKSPRSSDNSIKFVPHPTSTAPPTSSSMYSNQASKYPTPILSSQAPATSSSYMRTVTSQDRRVVECDPPRHMAYSGQITAVSQSHSSSSTTPDSSLEKYTPPVDYSVTSGDSSSMYYPRSQPSRPNSAPHFRSRDKRRAEAALAHGDAASSRDPRPQSLDVQPMYSPRPLPASARNMGHGVPRTSATMTSRSRTSSGGCDQQSYPPPVHYRDHRGHSSRLSPITILQASRKIDSNRQM